MSEADSLRAFTTSLVEDLGGTVRDDGSLLWLTIPESVQAVLDLPEHACVTFDAERVGEFDAELVAPGSYLLEKLLSLATGRGRWDVARLTATREDWPDRILAERSDLAQGARLEIGDRCEQTIVLFAFRTTLTSDEKRESFHLIAATLDGGEAWSVPWPVVEDGLESAAVPGYAPDLRPAYDRARKELLNRMGSEMGSFQKSSLAALEEEVGRIFHYFHGTVAEVREAAPSGAEDIVRVIEAERDRRLTEAVERLEVHAVASLCSVRLVLVPMARLSTVLPDGTRIEARVDALTREIRGLPESLTGAGSARPQDGPRSDTPRPRRKGGPASGRFPRGSTERSRSAGDGRPGR